MLDFILPSWWNDNFLDSQSGILEFGILVKSRLGLNVFFDDEGGLHIETAKHNVEYKRRINTSLERLIPATSIGHGIASTMASIFEANSIAPPTAQRVRDRLSSLEIINLELLASSLWDINIPVFYVDALPSSVSRPAGMIANIDGYISVILGHKIKSQAAQSFVLAHEIGHYISGHLDQTDILADVNIAELDNTLVSNVDRQEQEADSFALSLLRRGQNIEDFFSGLGDRPSSAFLAHRCLTYGKEHYISPAHLALSFGKHTNNWATAWKAIRFIEKGETAKEIVLSSFERGLSDLDVKKEALHFLKNVQGLSESVS